MKQGDTIEIVIESIGGGGEGLARCGGHTVVVPFALTGEKAAAKVVHVKRDGTVFASLKNIEKPSADRVNPPCPFFGECGGCHLMHMSYPAQLNFKRRLVAENLKKIGGLDVEVMDTEPSENVTGYRNKVQQPLGFDGKEAFTGFFRTGTHDIVRVKRCLLQQREARQAAEIFCDFANRRKISVYDEKTGKGLLRHFLARYENGQLLATVVVNGSSLPRWEELYRALTEVYPKTGLFLNENRKRSNVILGEKTVFLKGISQIDSVMCGVKFCLQPDSFFQVNTSVAEKIYRKVKELAVCRETDALIECFSGVGVLSAMLADDSYDSYGIEIVRSAWQDAEKIRRTNNLERLTNICGDVNRELPFLAERYAGKNVTVVVDPPRKGLDEKTRRTLIELNPRTLIYVSCDSATLARDAAHFVSAGFSLDLVRPYDMFPNTKHVETLVLLSKKIHDSQIGILK